MFVIDPLASEKQTLFSLRREQNRNTKQNVCVSCNLSDIHLLIWATCANINIKKEAGMVTFDVSKKFSVSTTL